MAAADDSAVRLTLARLRGASAGVYRALASSPGRTSGAEPAAQSAASWQMLLAEAPVSALFNYVDDYRKDECAESGCR